MMYSLMGFVFFTFEMPPQTPIFGKVVKFSDASQITYVGHINLPGSSLIYFYQFNSYVGVVCRIDILYIITGDMRINTYIKRLFYVHKNGLLLIYTDEVRTYHSNPTSIYRLHQNVFTSLKLITLEGGSIKFIFFYYASNL